MRCGQRAARGTSARAKGRGRAAGCTAVRPCCNASRRARANKHQAPAPCAHPTTRPTTITSKSTTHIARTLAHGRMHTHPHPRPHPHTHAHALTHTHTHDAHAHTHAHARTRTCVSTRHASPGRGVARARLRGCPLRWRRTRAAGWWYLPGHGRASAMRLAVRQSVLQPASHPVATATPRKRPATRKQHTRARPRRLRSFVHRALRCVAPRVAVSQHARRVQP
jgi:hypothetical protein